MQINAKELRQHLSDYLSAASKGQVVNISMRGKPVARLSSIEPVSKSKDDDFFGIWADDERDVAEYVRDMRKGRQF
ncbi:type II toxin-antitoxin system Phd/YefM family antitoxin [Ghiorsea bivora]|uniref:type II toxin-antitoxin system Phd/YefM family antitoxin n=1 Tax=Ghiorsea bivora TaxID=1485545 RepID=UPI00057117AF|nr:type II toxin-antitoxin system prevent-host-death family antitoxin [Ghiorsea bivora]